MAGRRISRTWRSNGHAQAAQGGRRLSGAKRAAILFLGLPQDQASRVMGLRVAREIRETSMVMARLAEVKPPTVEAACNDFAHPLADGGPVAGTSQRTERLLRGALTGRDDLIESIMSDIGGPSFGTAWEKIATAEAKTLAEYLVKEPPQVAADVLALLALEVVGEVMRRLLALKPVGRDILEDSERALRQDLAIDGSKAKKEDPVAVLADFIGQVDGDTASRLLGMLEAASPDQAAQVRKRMFTSADLVKISKAAIKALLQDCDKSRLAVALKCAEDARSR